MNFVYYMNLKKKQLKKYVIFKGYLLTPLYTEVNMKIPACQELFYNLLILLLH